jgi:hypothetical protein
LNASDAWDDGPVWLARLGRQVDRVQGALWTSWVGVVSAGRGQGWRFAGIGVGVGVVVVTLVRLIVAAGVQASAWWVRIGAVAVAMLVLLAVLNVMLRWYLRHKAEPGDQFPLLAAIILAVLATGLSVIAFAGLADVLWLAGYVSTPPGVGGPPSYPLIERSYLWNLIASVPLLAIPRRLGWADPLPLAGMAAGGVLLAFKIALIAPLLRVAQATYSAVEGRWLQAHERRTKTLELVNQDLRTRITWNQPPPVSGLPAPSRWPFVSQPRPGSRAPAGYGTEAGGQVGVALAAVVAVLLAWMAPRLPDYLPGAIGAWTGKMIGTGLLWLVAIWLVAACVWGIPRRGGDIVGESLTGLTMLCLAWIVQATCAAVAVVGLLLRAGATSISPPASGLAGAASAFEILAWELCDALPGPDIPATLGWIKPGELTGRYAAVVECAYLVVVAVVLAFPIGRALRTWAQGPVRQWEDPQGKPPAPTRRGAVRSAADQVQSAKEALVHLAETASDNKVVWYWMQRYVSHPWLAQQPGVRRRRSAARLRPRERRLVAAVNGVEVGLVGLQDARATLLAALPDEPLLSAFDAAAAALRRHYLYLNEDFRGMQVLPRWNTTGDSRDLAAVAWMTRSTNEAVQAFVDLALAFEASAQPQLPTGPESPWTGDSVEQLETAARTRPATEVLEQMIAIPFRAHPDAERRIETVLSALAQRPPADVAEVATALYVLEHLQQGSGIGQLQTKSTRTLLRQAAQRPRQDLVDIAIALIDRHAGLFAGTAPFPRQVTEALDQADQESFSASRKEHFRRRPDALAGMLIAATQSAPAAERVELMQALRAAGLDEPADGLLDTIGWSAKIPQVVEAVDLLHAMGLHENAQRVLRVAGTRGSRREQTVLGHEHSRSADVPRLIAALGERGRPDDLLMLIGTNLDRPEDLRTAIAAQLRQTAIEESVWRPLLEPSESAPDHPR